MAILHISGAPRSVAARSQRAVLPRLLAAEAASHRYCERTFCAGPACTSVPKRAEGLEGFRRQELVFLLDRVSQARVCDVHVWDAYANRALPEVASCRPEELCSILRSFSRVGFGKRSLLNAVSRRLRSMSRKLRPELLVEAIDHLRKLRHLDGPLLLALLRPKLTSTLEKEDAEKQKLSDAVLPSLLKFQTVDLPRVLYAFARSAVRDEPKLCEVGRALRMRAQSTVLVDDEQAAGEITPNVIATSIFSLALLDCSAGGTAGELASSAVARRLADFSRRELVNLAFSLVLLDLPRAEMLSFILERLSRQSRQLQPTEMHALRIVEHCFHFPEAFCPAMRSDVANNGAAQSRSRAALDRIAKAGEGALVPYVLTSSKLQRHLERFFDKLNVPHKAEESAGPYHLDFALPQRVAVEVDGFKHFYAFSRRFTAKSALKLRILKAMGWRVVSLPHFEWLPRNERDRLTYLATQIEAAAGAPLAVMRQPEAGQRTPWLRGQRGVAPLAARAPPARGQFSKGVRR